MRRKVNLVGTNTLTISLPAKWAASNNIDKGDELDIIEKENTLTISSLEQKPLKKSVRIEITGLAHTFINRYLQECYRQGIESITLLFEKKTIPNPKKNAEINVTKHINGVVDRLIGMEITSVESNSITIEALTHEHDEQKLQVVQNRIYYLLKDFCAQLQSAVNNKFGSFYESHYAHHDTITKFIWYYLRLLHFSHYEKSLKERYVSLYLLVDKTIDKLRHVCERINEQKTVSQKVEHYLDSIIDIYLSFFTIFLQKTTKKDINDLIKKRYEVVHKYNQEHFTPNELKIVAELNLLLNVVTDFAETFVSIQLTKNDFPYNL